MTRTQGLFPALRLQRLQLRDFRCHPLLDVCFEQGINLISGENGSGKTSVLEAIHMMATGSSFRRSRARDLLRWQQDRYQIRGHWHRYGVLHVAVEGDRVNTMVALQGRAISRRGELRDQLALVVDSPQSERLVDADPKGRRRWIDRLVMTTYPSVSSNYHGYYRAMLQRSRVIRQGGRPMDVLPWNAQMVRQGRAWFEARARLVSRLNTALSGEDWLGESLHIEVGATTPDCDEKWLKILESTHRSLRVGPHCDRVAIVRGGREVFVCGSHGQQKLCAIALRLAECALRAESHQLFPLLMLDDGFEALDSAWRMRVIRRLQSYPGQVLLTAPDEGDSSLLTDTGQGRVIFLGDTGEKKMNGTGGWNHG